MTSSDRAGEPSYTGVREAAGDVGNVTTGPGQRVNTGHGNQFNDVGVVIVSEYSGRERHHKAEPLRHSAEQREYLRKRFVKPPEFDQAERALASSGTVFISGAPGSGRRSAAMMLLWRRFPGEDAIYRRLTLDSDDGERPLDPDSVQQGELLLLDLSGEDDEDEFAVVRRRLETFRASVERNRAALVVVLPAEADHLLGEEFAQPRIEISRPSGKEVLRRHLVEGGVGLHEQALSTLGTYPTTGAMRDLERLAQRIAEAKAKYPEEGFAKWAARAGETVAKYGAKVANQVKRCDPGQRALLLTAAMLEGAHADAAYTARNKLLAKLVFPEDERHVLEREGLDDVLRSVEVEPTASRRIRFASLRYSEAVRDHFWANYPELRDALRDWVGECVDLVELSDEDEDRLVARFAGQACRTGRVADLWELAERWTRRKDEGRPRHDAMRWAASALAYGLQDDRDFGSRAAETRRKIYEWAVNPRQQVDLARVLVSVCANVMADGHPEQALVRLRWLAAHRSIDVAEAARKAIRELADNTRLYRRFLWRMVTWLAQAKQSDVELFLDVSDADRLLRRGSRPRALVRSRVVREQLVGCWRVTFAFDESVWRSRALDWFAASRGDSDSERLLDVLVAATDGKLPHLARLHVLARDWAHGAAAVEESAARHEVFRKLAIRMDRAQQLRLRNSEEKTC